MKTRADLMRYLYGHDERDSRFARNMRGLKTFNRLVSKFTASKDGIGKLRRDAINCMLENKNYNVDLICLAEILKCRYPHWFNGAAGKIEMDPTRAAKLCRLVFDRLDHRILARERVSISKEHFEEINRPRIIQEKRITCVHVGPRRTAAASRPTPKTCSVHEGKKTVYRDQCSLCYSRLRLLTGLGWLTPETPHERTLEVRRLPKGKGRKSKFRTWAYQILVEGRSPLLDC